MSKKKEIFRKVEEKRKISGKIQAGSGTIFQQKLRAKRLAQLKRFLREHTWGVMITGLILIALILFVCVIAGAAPKEAPAPETTQDETPRYESGFICAITTQVPYYTEELSEAGTVARGMQITYSTDKSVERDGIRSMSARRRTSVWTKTRSSSARWSKRERSCRF